MNTSIMKAKILTAICILTALFNQIDAQVTSPGLNEKVTPGNITSTNIAPSESRLTPSYKVETRRGVSHFSIHRFCGGSEVRIKIMQNAVENNDIEDFSLSYDSGNEYRMGSIHGIENITFPLYVKVTYRSWNASRTGRFDVAFEFTINDPGVWNVTIFN
jgi:hypothetical protein